jgi:hypothetical protein
VAEAWAEVLQLLDGMLDGPPLWDGQGFKLLFGCTVYGYDPGHCRDYNRKRITAAVLIA